MLLLCEIFIISFHSFICGSGAIEENPLIIIPVNPGKMSTLIAWRNLRLDATMKRLVIAGSHNISSSALVPAMVRRRGPTWMAVFDVVRKDSHVLTRDFVATLEKITPFTASIGRQHDCVDSRGRIESETRKICRFLSRIVHHAIPGGMRLPRYRYDVRAVPTATRVIARSIRIVLKFELKSDRRLVPCTVPGGFVDVDNLMTSPNHAKE